MKPVWFCICIGRHFDLKTHSGEKPNKCNQCDFASTECVFKWVLKTHSGNIKQMQWVWLYILPGRQSEDSCYHELSDYLSERMQSHTRCIYLIFPYAVQKCKINAIYVTIHPLNQPIWWTIWKCTFSRNNQLYGAQTYLGPTCNWEDTAEGCRFPSK